MVMPLIRNISSMPACSWMRHQSFLMVFRLLVSPTFFPLRSVIPKMSSRARTNMAPPSWTWVAPKSRVRRMSACTAIGG